MQRNLGYYIKASVFNLPQKLPTWVHCMPHNFDDETINFMQFSAPKLGTIKRGTHSDAAPRRKKD